MTKQVSLNIQNHVKKRANLGTAIINYIDGEENLENDFDIFTYFNEQKVQEPKFFDLKKIFNLLAILVNNHHQGPDFFTKIMEIITYFKNDIKKNLTNKEFFDIFSSNSRILYFLFENKLIEPEESIIEILKKPNKIDYLEPVIEMYHTNQPFDDYDEKMREKRKSGKNDSPIAKMIQNDSVQEFIQYMNINNFSLESKIKQYYFETNPLLMEKEPTLIEYAAFYGAIQIFNFLKYSGVELTSSLWIYTIHSKNPELIHCLEENNVEPEKNEYDSCIIEAIKCHHNEIAIYLIDKANHKKMKYLLYYLMYDNYELISIDPDSYSNSDLTFDHFLQLAKYNSEFTDLLFKESYLNINHEYDYGKTLFSLAFQNHDIKYIEFLLSNPKINPNRKILNGKTALIISVEKNDMQLIKLLLACPNTNPNIINEETIKINHKKFYLKKTALTIAIEKEMSEVIQLLLQNKRINPNLSLDQYNKERTLLSEAIKNDNMKLINILLSCPNTNPNIIHEYKSNGEQFTPLSMAIQKGSKEIINILLSNDRIIPNSKIYINKEEKTELLIALEKGNDEIIQLLLQSEKIDSSFVFRDKNNEDRTVLSMAVEEENIKLVKLLLSSPSVNIYTKLRKSITYQGETKSENTIMNLALYKNNRDIINLFFEHKRRSLSK